MKVFSVILLLIAILIESALTTLPLTLLVLLSLAATFKKDFIFVLAFVFGILLDLLTLRTIGGSSIFFIIFVYLILLYRGKFEIATYTFIVVASFLGSLLYLLVNHNFSNLILEPFVSSILGLLIFIFTSRLMPAPRRHE